METVQALVAAGADANATGSWCWWPALMESALVAAGADPNATGEDGRTALMGAAVGGHAETVQALVAAGADANATGKDGRTALMEAAARGHAEIAQALITAGVSTRPTRDGWTALMGAARGPLRKLEPLGQRTPPAFGLLVHRSAG